MVSTKTNGSSTAIRGDSRRNSENRKRIVAGQCRLLDLSTSSLDTWCLPLCTWQSWL